VKDHAERVAPAAPYPANAVAHLDAILTARTAHGAVVHREHDGIALRQRHHLCARLHAGALLGEHEFAAFEILAGDRQERCHLQREHVLAVEILM